MRILRMKGLAQSHFTRNVALIVLGYSAALPSAWADGNRPQADPQPVSTNISSRNLGISKAVIGHSPVTIEHVQAADLDRHVEIRVVGNGALSCTPSRLNDPDRLVLDCAGAHVQTGQMPIRVDLSPVRTVRVGQFKTDVARVVIDLDAQSPYTMQAHGDTVTVVFDSIGRQSSPLKPTETPTAPIAQPNDGEGALTASTTSGMNNSPVARSVDVPAPPAEMLPVDQLGSSQLPMLPPAPIAASDPPVVSDPPSNANAGINRTEPNHPGQDYVIGPQDVLAINVWRETELSRSIPVRPDGKMSFPLIGEMMASGLTPVELQSQIVKGLGSYIRDPQVTVIIQEANSHKFYVLGEVERPGAYPLATSMTVLDALAIAGGFRDFAKVKQIYLLRLMPDGSRKRIRFDYKAAVNGDNSYRDVGLQTGDTLVVP